MKDKTGSMHSCWMVSLPVVCVSFAGGTVAAFLGWRYPAAVLIFISVLGLTAGWWGKASSKKLRLKVGCGGRAFFPGDLVSFRIEISNNKFLPVVWTELFCPIAKEKCIIPEEGREPDEWERMLLREEGASEELVGIKHFPLLLWHETSEYASEWKACRRGIYSTENWRIRTGDGFGLMQTERKPERGEAEVFTVYPSLISVNSEVFMKNLWDSVSGNRGVLQDPTVIRASREYMSGDPVKNINWRLTARGLPLSVNVYEDIIPRGVHFILDGESFSGKEKHSEELEETISIIASEAVLLCEKEVSCGLSVSKGKRAVELNRFAEKEPYGILQLLAEYLPEEDIFNEEGSEIIDRSSSFEESSILESMGETGRFYYVTYDAERLNDNGLLQKLGSEKVSVISYVQGKPYPGYETLCLNQLKEGM